MLPLLLEASTQTIRLERWRTHAPSQGDWKSWIHYHQFMQSDVESTEARASHPPSQADGTIAVSGHSGDEFYTLGEMTEVVAAFELWTTEPAPPTSPFDALDHPRGCEEHVLSSR
ncbi:hypothetical protein [Amycolatopsis sp. NPDC052450]|uniref:hypothetical protein n=1 Tax=Amycolatopsis sp. NPDC052450 TaxID=3363937 RepID=UPI0037CB0A5F